MMKEKVKNILGFLGRLLGRLRFIPAILVFYIHSKRWVIEEDLKVWKKELGRTGKMTALLRYFLATYPEFRNVFYHRVGGAWSRILTILCLCPKMSTLYINTRDIGPGLFIGHGFATMIAAKSIGKNCIIYQQVTIGYKDMKQVTIGDNVQILAGAIAIGGITIGDNAKLGAGVTVTKDVPANCSAVGAPFRIIGTDEALANYKRLLNEVPEASQ